MPTTPLAMKLRRWLVVVIIALLLVVGARVAVLDIVGAIALFISLNIGVCVVDEKSSTVWTACFGASLLTGAVLDTASVGIIWARAPQLFLSKTLPFYYNVVNGVLALGPVLESSGAFLCFLLYKEHVAGEGSDIAIIDPFGPVSSGYGTAEFTHCPNTSAKQHFQGQAYRLESTI